MCYLIQANYVSKFETREELENSLPEVLDNSDKITYCGTKLIVCASPRMTKIKGIQYPMFYMNKPPEKPHEIFEDDLPDIDKEVYDLWYSLSYISDGVRVGPTEFFMKGVNYKITKETK